MVTSVVDLPQVEELYRSLEDKVRLLRPKDELASLERAYRYGADVHKKQKR